tara:strand:- start:1390 stop:1872 length:483 start_codon:yes stop_codon:yes gene_type:complete
MADNPQRPKKVLSEAKIKALEKMKIGREAWLKEKARCKAEGLPPPISKNSKKKIELKIEDVAAAAAIQASCEDEIIDQASIDELEESSDEEELKVVKKKVAKKKKKKKQVVINNYYEEVESESSSSEEEEVINNHYRTYSNNPHPTFQQSHQQEKIIRFV